MTARAGQQGPPTILRPRVGLGEGCLGADDGTTTRTAAAKSAKTSMYEHSTIAPLTDFVDDDEMRTTKGDDPDTDRSAGPWAAP